MLLLPLYLFCQKTQGKSNDITVARDAIVCPESSNGESVLFVKIDRGPFLHEKNISNCHTFVNGAAQFRLQMKERPFIPALPRAGLSGPFTVIDKRYFLSLRGLDYAT
jgi:hypothetical protein